MVESKKYSLLSYIIIFSSVLALGIAYLLEFFNIYPCRLCIYQRVIYYILALVGIFILIFVKKNFIKPYIVCSEFIIYVLLIGGIGLSVFQVMIEHNLIEYESACTTSFNNIHSPEEFLSSINEKDLVACDKPQIIVYGISLAGLNCLYMLLVLFISLFMIYKNNFPIKNFEKK
jgi:disulfide bond formation protein DsbB